MTKSNVIEWDEDSDGLVCAVTSEGERWFCLLIPDDVTGDAFMAMQAALREIAQRFGCVPGEVD